MLLTVDLAGGFTFFGIEIRIVAEGTALFLFSTDCEFPDGFIFSIFGSLLIYIISSLEKECGFLFGPEKHLLALI